MNPLRQGLQSPRRRTVRIVKHRTLPRAATVSLAITAATAVVMFVIWRTWRSENTVTVVQRTLADVELTWKCDAGHTFTAEGQVGSRECRVCREPAYPITTYECKVHGPIEVAARFSQEPSGAARVSDHRVHGGEWVSADIGVACPRCNAPLLPKRVDPLEGVARTKKKG